MITVVVYIYIYILVSIRFCLKRNPLGALTRKIGSCCTRCTHAPLVRRPPCIDCCNAMQRSRTRRPACVSQGSNVPRELHIATPPAPCYPSTLAICCTFLPPAPLPFSCPNAPKPNLSLLFVKCRPPLSLQLAPPVLFSCPSTPSRPSPSSYPPSTKAACLPRWPQAQPKCANGL